ncbi:MAG: putative HMP/thiamine import ATP-binding protein YkoD [Actinobacteria bacterium]|nr:putative HMP/thiamine import ATP-binding protein YkoD [Actinomycetota bacterium]
MKRDKAVEFESLSFLYQGTAKEALDDVSLEIEEGEFVTWMGHTGAGKSTLVYCLNALIPSFIRGELKGKARVLGRDILQSRTSEMSREVGLIFQDFEAQLFSTSVELEVAFGLENKGMPRHQMKDIIDESLCLVRLEELRDREPSTLSGGQKQRLAIASVLAMHPRLLAMDEPTTDLDPVGKWEVFQLARKLQGPDRTIILVEHETEEALSADRVMLLKEGRLLREGSPEEILSNSKLLLEAGVAPLPVAEFFSRLGESLGQRNGPPPLTLEEAISEFRKRLRLRPSARQFLEGKNQGSGKGSRKKTALKMERVYYCYPSGVEALKGIDLEIGEGEFVAIIGQNGSGKTTLAKMFNGLLRPTSGRVGVFGQEVGRLSRRELGRTVGYVFQNPDHQIFASTVFEEVAFGPRNFGLEEKVVRRNAEEALAAVNLLGYEDQDPFILTKGERQRVAVASVLAVKPQVLILDEPTTGLDYLQQQFMMKMVASLNQKGHTTIIITHSMSTVANYAHRIVVLHEGQVLVDDTTRSVFSREIELERACLRPPQIVRFGNQLGITPLTVEEMLEVTESKS